jgi:hypothetical protein
MTEATHWEIGAVKITCHLHIDRGSSSFRTSETFSRRSDRSGGVE